MLIVLAAVVWVSLFRAEYGLCMVLLTAVFYVFYTQNILKTVLGCIISLMYITGPLSFYGIWCYNGERKDRINKYVYYAFYPVHLLVLGVIAKYSELRGEQVWTLERTSCSTAATTILNSG